MAVGVSPIALKPRKAYVVPSGAESTRGRGGLGQVVARSERPDPALLQGLHGLPQRPLAVVAGVVVGQRQRVEPRVLEHRHQRRAAPERVVAGLLRLAVGRQRALEVADGEVRAAQQPAHRRQGGGRVGDAADEHHVAGHHHAWSRPRGRGPGRRRPPRRPPRSARPCSAVRRPPLPGSRSTARTLRATPAVPRRATRSAACCAVSRSWGRVACAITTSGSSPPGGAGGSDGRRRRRGPARSWSRDGRRRGRIGLLRGRVAAARAAPRAVARASAGRRSMPRCSPRRSRAVLRIRPRPRPPDP